MKRFLAAVPVLAATTAIAAAVVLGTVGPQPSGEAGIRKAFAVADVNSDSVMDVNEFVANTIYLIKQMDSDHDGKLSVQEWSIGAPGSGLDGFKAIDRNADGKVSVGEAVAAKMIEFFDTDANHDGAITIDELLAYERGAPTATARK